MLLNSLPIGGLCGEACSFLFTTDHLWHPSFPITVPSGMASSSSPPQFTKHEHSLQDPPLCFWCDEGGATLFCDGPCLRHLHWMLDDPKAGIGCPTLRLTHEKVVALLKQWIYDKFQKWKNCCFICGLEGHMIRENSEDPTTWLDRCADDFCTCFYHANCAKQELQAHGHLLEDGELDCWWTCPRHYCQGCKLPEQGPREYIHCLRCPNSWCVDCYKSQENKSWTSKGIGIFKARAVRANGEELLWQCIYCDKHPIVKSLGTPCHNHY